jgi:hypothetical protein
LVWSRGLKERKLLGELETGAKAEAPRWARHFGLGTVQSGAPPPMAMETVATRRETSTQHPGADVPYRERTVQSLHYQHHRRWTTYKILAGQMVALTQPRRNSSSLISISKEEADHRRAGARPRQVA